MKHIVLVGNTSWSMIKFRYGLMKSLILNGYKVTVVAPKDEYIQDIKDIGCEYREVDIDNKGSNPIKDIKLIYTFQKIYNELEPDLVIHYTIKPNIYGIIAAKISGIKAFAVITGLGYVFINDSIVSTIAKQLYKFSFRFATKVFFINKDDKNEFLNNNLVNKDKIVVIPGEGINTKYFKDINKTKKLNKFKFLLIARMLEDKGVFEYIEAGKILSKKYNNFEIGLLGYLGVDNPKAISKQQMDILIQEDYIKYYSSTNDVKPFISQSDCIVLPSYREGISMTLMESASMAKPLIATNVPGCKELIDDEINGYLCEVKSVKDLALKMEMMLKLSEEERIYMGKKGREKMQREFDKSIVIEKYLNIIKKLIRN